MTLVSGQPDLSLIEERLVKVNEDLAFLTYYGEQNQAKKLYILEGNQAEEIVWTDTPSNFNPYYRGQLDNKYYFFSIFGQDGLLYEYNHTTRSTRKIPFPPGYACASTNLLTDNLNGKIYFACGMQRNGIRQS